MDEMPADILTQIADDARPIVRQWWAGRKISRNRLSVIIVGLAMAFLITGFFSPCFSIVPSFGDAVVDTMLINYFPELMEPQTFSIVGGIASLYGHGEFGLATIILTFSVLLVVSQGR